MAQVDVDVAAMHAALSLVPGGKRWEGALRRLDHFALTKFHDCALAPQPTAYGALKVRVGCMRREVRTLYVRIAVGRIAPTNSEEDS